MRKNANSYHLVQDGYMGADITSDSTNILFQDNVGFVIEWDGTDVDGYLYVQVQNGNSEWVNYESPIWTPGLLALESNTGAEAINLPNVGFERIRLFYDRTDGEGTLNAYITTKG